MILNKAKIYLYFCIIIFSITTVIGQETVRLNQIGFYPNAPKFAVVVGAAANLFYITTTSQTDTLFSGGLGIARIWPPSGETVKLIDFTGFREIGEFKIVLDNTEQSYPFSIDNEIHQNLSRGILKGYYFKHASEALDIQYAGVWNRPAGHPDTLVRIHASAATNERPVNSIISASKGWYDAGDYNKYIVNSGISTYTILAAYEHYSEYYQDFELNIPASGNGIPDILDEALWNIRWMLSMQDPNDGGVYHKLTTDNFSGAVMPHQATGIRYVVQKSTPATLDFAAVMAQASRIFRNFNTEMPGFADSCLNAALYAWNWARKNPNMRYDQSTMNIMYDPDINTGEYGDGNFTDEFQWAAAELYVTTHADSFLFPHDPLAGSFGLPWWGGVNSLGLYTLVHHRATIGNIVDTTLAISFLLSLADGLKNEVTNSAYHIVMGGASWNFVWGSNGIAANQGMALIQAFNATGDSTYLEAALQNLDYLLGRNAVAYSFVTGFGKNPPMHPHHRPSEADGIIDPIPGVLVGGPNMGREDGCPGYIGTEPARSYVDSWCSYASNEIAINWDAPLVYLTGAIESAYSQESSTSIDQNENKLLPKGFGLEYNYPNPFNPSTSIIYSVPDRGDINLSIYNICGQLIRVLMNSEHLQGRYTITWDGLSDKGIKTPSGIYIVRLYITVRSHTYVDSMKITLLR